MSDVKKGDRVKVTIEGDYDPEEFGFYLNGRTSWVNNKAVTSIEKIEPPVETFGPGDVVRGKQQAPDYVALAETGYLELSEGGKFYPYCKGSIGITPAHFTSERYERVTIS